MITAKKVKIKKLHPDAIIPKYETSGAAGMDLCSIGEYNIRPNHWKTTDEEGILVKTGLAIECPEGYEIQIRPRSGLAKKLKITLMNSPGTLDSDYRGEIGLLVTNHGIKNFNIKPGDRVAQMVLNEITLMDLEEVDELSETNRGEGGYGSTGK
jgi:dUTP pyrophosphatase